MCGLTIDRQTDSQSGVCLQRIAARDTWKLLSMFQRLHNTLLYAGIVVTKQLSNNNHTVSPMLTLFCRSNKTLNRTQFDFYCFNNTYVLTRSVSELRGFRNPKISPPTFNHTNLNPVIFTYTKAKHKTLFLYPGSKRNNKPADAGWCVQIYSTGSPSFPFSPPPPPPDCHFLVQHIYICIYRSGVFLLGLSLLFL